MKLKILLLTFLLTLSAIASEITLQNILTVNPKMDMIDLTKQLESIPDNTYIEWKSGAYKFDKLYFRNKKNIYFDFEKNVVITANNILFEKCDNIRFDAFKLINSDDGSVIIIQDSSDIYIARGEFESKDLKNGGIYLENSKNVALIELSFTKMNETNHININNSIVYINSCKFYKKDDKYSILSIENSTVEVFNSNFSSEYKPAIFTLNSDGTIDGNNFYGLLNKKSKDDIQAIYIRGNSDFNIIDNSIENYLRGIDIIDSQARITNNRIKNANTGIALEKSKSIISENVLEKINNNKLLEEKPVYIGISVRDSYAEITSNKISETTRGINVNNSDTRINNNSISNTFDTDDYNGIGISLFNGEKPYVTARLANNSFINVKNHYYGDDKTAVTLITDYDKYKEFFEAGTSQTIDVPKSNVDINYTPINVDNIVALKDSKIDNKTVKILNPTMLSGVLVDDLIVKDMVLDPGQYIKIDTNTMMILFPEEYKGIFLDELPKLQSTNLPYEIKTTIDNQGILNVLNVQVATQDSIKFIKYKGKLNLNFTKKDDMQSGLSIYSFSIKLKNSDKPRSFSFIANDGKEVIKKFIVNNDTFQLVEDIEKKADF